MSRLVVHKPDEHRQLRTGTQAMQLITRAKHLESPSGLARGSSMPWEVPYRSCCWVYIEGCLLYDVSKSPGDKESPLQSRLDGCKASKNASGRRQARHPRRECEHTYAHTRGKRAGTRTRTRTRTRMKAPPRIPLDYAEIRDRIVDPRCSISIWHPDRRP